ncbi:MAG: hypothetical protein JWM53_5315 [bacterium]|nr:hypothetical protein [bacterium]
MRAEALTNPTPAVDADEPITRHQQRERRVQVAAVSCVRTPHGARAVRIVGLSARTALVLSTEPLGWPGQCVELDVPVVGGRDLAVLAGIVRAERVSDGHATAVEFVVVDAEVRRQLNDLLALLLAHEPEADVRQPRVVYDVAVAYGPTGQRRAHLQEVSLTGLSMRVAERMAHDLVVDVTLPSLRGTEIAVRGRVTGQRLSAEGGYVTALDFEPLDGARRNALGVLLADLLCR